MSTRKTCYSDHDHDIWTVGACTLCGDTEPDGTREARHMSEPVPAPESSTPLADILPACRKVLDEQAFQTVIVDGGEVLVDLQTANVVVAVHDALGDAARAKADAMPFMKFVLIAWKLAVTP